MVGSISCLLSDSFGTSEDTYSKANLLSNIRISNMILNPMLSSSSTDWEKKQRVMANDKFKNDSHSSLFQNYSSF